jgi:hypothetical protein
VQKRRGKDAVRGKAKANAPVVHISNNIRCACGVACINAGHAHYQYLLDHEHDPDAAKQAPEKKNQGYGVSVASAVVWHPKGFLKSGHWCCPMAPKAVAEKFFKGRTCADMFSTFLEFKEKAGRGGPHWYPQLFEAASAEGALDNPQMHKLGCRNWGELVLYDGRVRVVVLIACHAEHAGLC